MSTVFACFFSVFCKIYAKFLKEKSIKMDMYNRINQLCKENHTNITALCRILNISRSTLSELKSGRTKTLSAEYASKISQYFHVTVDYLLGKTDQKNIPAESAKELSFDDFTYAMHHEGKKLSEENKMKLLEMAKFFVQQQEKEQKRK